MNARRARIKIKKRYRRQTQKLVLASSREPFDWKAYRKAWLADRHTVRIWHKHFCGDKR